MLLEISHDIRTPIATIKSSAIALEQGIIAEQELDKYYQMIRLKAERVTLLADDMFTMLKMKSPEYVLDKTDKDLCEFLRRLCGEYYQDIDDAGLSLSVNIPEEPMMYNADYLLLARAIGNLITNAVIYNKTGSEIKIFLKATADACILCVADDGEAINSEVSSHMFDEFSRGDSSRTSDGGSGIGLAITKAIIERHAGSIEYRRQDKLNQFVVQLL